MSLHFYSYNEDIPKKESLIDFENIFKEFINNVPSLKEALYQMFKLEGIPDQEVYDLTNEILLKSEKIIKFNFDIIKEKYPFITIEEAKIISSYTCEASKSDYSPYKILNRNLCEENRTIGINNISKYLFIFIKSLRKLNKYYPKQKYMYRCINRQVNLKEDIYNKKIIPYKKGNTKIFWGFTSITSDINMTYDLNGKKKY